MDNAAATQDLKTKLFTGWKPRCLIEIEGSTRKQLLFYGFNLC